MDILPYITSDNFRFIKPLQRLPSFVTAYLYDHPRLQTCVEQWNAADKQNTTLRKELSGLACKRFSTLAIGVLLQKLVAQLPLEQCYLNIGTWYGFSLFAGMYGNADKQCIGIDDFSLSHAVRDPFYRDFARLRSPAHAFHEMDFRRYLRMEHQCPIGLYAFDGPHDEQSQYDALTLAEPFFAKNCIIIVDDTNWPEPRSATERFLQERPHRYDIIADVPTAFDRHPTLWNGLMILQKR